MIQDHYKILGLTRSATKVDIKKAYRKLALQWHPDKNKSSEAHNMFIKINEAYLILYDEEARVKYDKEYEYFFGVEQEFSEKEPQNDYKADDKEQQSYHDPDLNNWSRTAKKQANKYAAMSFDDFAKLIGEVIKETSRQGFTAIIYAISGVTGASGIFSIIGGIRYGDYPQIGFSIILLALAAIGINYTTKKYHQ
jgi:curved DNA-binding protein CbpA